MSENKSITFETKRLNDFSISELYQTMALRSQIFVVEQNCVYQDLDGKDDKALHLLMRENAHIIGYARIFDVGDYFDEVAIGRVVVATEARRGGLGTLLVNTSIKEAVKHLTPATIRISAQKHLVGFYTACGFKAFGKEYMEDGIPHMAMRWEA